MKVAMYYNVIGTGINRADSDFLIIMESFSCSLTLAVVKGRAMLEILEKKLFFFPACVLITRS
jgi:hypothetical protein